METKKLFEVGTEGGSIAIFKTENALKEVWFYYTVKEMGLKEERIPPVNKTSEHYSSFYETFVGLLYHYRLFYFFPVMVADGYKNSVYHFMKAYLSSHKVENFKQDQWEEVLGIGISHECPFCKAALPFTTRYPNYVCKDCSSKATDKDGRALVFSNTDLSGGFIARYKGTIEDYDSHVCYINGVECYANEARFGGIVVEVK